MKSVEDEIQAGFFTAIRNMKNREPRLKWIHAIPNGGKRSIKTAVTMKATGTEKGIWDVFFPCPVKIGGNVINSGLYIEFKKPKTLSSGEGKLTVEQKEFYSDLKDMYAFAVCRSVVKGLEAVIHYLCTGNGTYHGSETKKKASEKCTQ